ncbi:hypothetical protein SEUCBS139899_009880 [Sporothrix eucalyptigena]|uniref:Uncharacterized protein n=1 Tax=Sporothrix eucalyptigena TaxID=1812306 RepID=A0ABP0D1T5_9PEZI
MATDEPYTGPSAREMIASHTLAAETIARHGSGSQAIFDDDNIRQLRLFVTDPAAARASVLAKLGFTEGDDTAAIIAKAASGSHSLVDYAVVTRGTDKEALTDGEMETLREWFASGGGQPQGN